MTQRTRRRAFTALATGALLLSACSSPDGETPATTRLSAPSGPAPVAVLTWPHAAINSDGPYPVVEVLDGQTARIDRGPDGGLTTIRLLGSVAPDPRDHHACFAAEASAEAGRLLAGQTVRIVADPRPGRVDADGRLLVYVWLTSGRMLNDVLVEGGFAREATGADPYLYRANFARSEELARREGRGLWSPGACDGNIDRPVPA